MSCPIKTFPKNHQQQHHLCSSVHILVQFAGDTLSAASSFSRVDVSLYCFFLQLYKHTKTYNCMNGMNVVGN